jgi:hypothetical protein
MIGRRVYVGHCPFPFICVSCRLYLIFINKCVLAFAAEIMANYAIQKQKRDAKGKGKVVPSGPPPSPAPVPAPIPVVPTGINISNVAPAGGASLAKRSVPPSSGAEVANVQQKRHCTTKSGMLLSFGIFSRAGTVCYLLIISFSSICR